MIMVMWPSHGSSSKVFLAPLVWLKILNMTMGINNLMMEALMFTFTLLSVLH